MKRTLTLLDSHDPSVITRKELADVLNITVNSVRRAQGIPEPVGMMRNHSICYNREKALAWAATKLVKGKKQPKENLEFIAFSDIFSGAYDIPTRKSLYEYRKFVSKQTKPMTVKITIEDPYE